MEIPVPWNGMEWNWFHSSSSYTMYRLYALNHKIRMHRHKIYSMSDHGMELEFPFHSMEWNGMELTLSAWNTWFHGMELEWNSAGMEWNGMELANPWNGMEWNSSGWNGTGIFHSMELPIPV